MRFWAAAAVLLTAVALGGNGPETGGVVRRVEVKGKLPGKGLEPQLAVGETLSAERLYQTAEEFQKALVEQGFLWAVVEWDTTLMSDGVAVTYRVTAGPKAKLGGWTLTGNESISKAILARNLPRRGTVLTRRVLASAMAELLSIYERNGFPFTGVSTPALRDSGFWVYPTLLINEGPQVRVDFLEFSGSSVVRRPLLLRAARFRPGTGYSTRVIQSWRRNLEKTGWVQVDSQELVTRDERFGARLWLKDKKASLVSGALGYLPEDGRFTGMVRLRFLNLLGTGRRFEANWQSAFSRTVYELSYTEPWVLGSLVTLSGSMRQLVIDTSYSHTTFGLAGAFGTGTVELVLETGYERLAGSVNNRTVWAGTGFGFDSRDRPLDPGSGVVWEVRTRVGKREGQVSTNSVVGRVEAGVGVFQRLKSSLSIANRIEARLVSSRTPLAEPELYRLGGAQNLRGYREGSFIAARVAWLSSELWFWFDEHSRFYPFFDLGVFEGAADRKWHWAPAYGIGGKWETRFGILGLDYGVAFRDTPLRGKVHLSYEGGF